MSCSGLVSSCVGITQLSQVDSRLKSKGGMIALSSFEQFLVPTYLYYH